ncbi:ABC transporter permease [Oceanobacillus manasiensis]|uniref:ABC transporter permease n=1 Tax=Oceanobacillus manasiensis TaxID=586413 RepID=UPI001E4F0742|nr:ABC transporter permease [Oceanobacillus manasiensis]
MKLAMANIRKSKSATASLFVFIMVASLLLNIGLMVITQLNPFFNNKIDELKDPHVTFVMDEAGYQPEYGDFLANYPGVTETEKEDILYMDTAKFQFGNGELTNSAVILNAEASRNIGPLELVEQLGTSSTDDIYVPYSFIANGGYELGDLFTITYQNKDYKYRISGFFETTVMGTNNIDAMKFMLPENAYQKLTDELDTRSEALLLSALIEDKTQASKINSEFVQKVQQSQEGNPTSYIFGLDVELVRYVNTLTINIIAMILVAFAAIIVLVSLIVIKFRVSNSIEDGMVNIGVLKAIGYTSWQILSSIILQFVFIALSAGMAGIILSYLLKPFIGGVISTLSGLIWAQSFDILINMVSTILVVFCVVIVTLLSAYRVRKILPVSALREGIQTHSFKKNYFPLEKAKGGLHFLLAIKSMISNAKQNIMILLIVIALTFATIFSAVLYYNIASDKTAFVNIFGAEPANVMVIVKPDADTRELLSDIENIDSVRKVNIFDLIETKIDGQTVYTSITDHFDELENNIVYEGRQPEHENEISISWVISNEINKGIGETVEVEYGSEKSNYLVTGISQSIGNLGQVAAITMEGVQQLNSDYRGTSLYVYLDEISNKDFIKNVQEQSSAQILETLDIDENIESQTGKYTTAVFAIMMLILIITVLVVVMILYLVIKTMIIKRKKEYGVMKAIGFSTIQLMHQIAISFLPVIIAAVTVGGVLGYFFTNPMLSLLLSSAGVKRLDFFIHVPMILMICLGVLFLAYIVSMMVALKIRKISAYELITE